MTVQQLPAVRLSLRSQDVANITLNDLSAFLEDVTLLYEVSRMTTDLRYLDRHSIEEYFYLRTLDLRSRAFPIRGDSVAQPGWESSLEPSDRLRIERLRLASPLDLVAQIPGAVSAAASAIALLSGIATIVLGHVKQGTESVKNIAEARKANAEAETTEMENERQRKRERSLHDRIVVIQGRSWEVLEGGIVVPQASQGNHREHLERRDFDELRQEIDDLLIQRDATLIFQQSLDRLKESPIQIEEMRATPVVPQR